ncbi:MAG: hypothetical protein JJT85_12105 [Chromatiales bacterium]|nr:hypothetical protein [Chromatiales bacterium]
MKALIVLFNLKPGASRSTYEAWAHATDLPVVRALPSVQSFDLYRTVGLFGSSEPAPYEYVEVIRIGDLDQFGKDVSSETMRKVASEFQGFADKPLFMLADIAGEAGQ